MPTPDVRNILDGYPEDARSRLLAVRDLIFEQAEALGAAPVTETLKWGVPAYLCKGGTTIRLAWSAESGPRMYVHCGTNLVERWRADYPEFSYEGARAVALPSGDLPEEPLRHMIGQALRYHQK